MDDQPDFRKHRILILETKLEILNRLSTGESGAALAKHYGVSKSTVSEIKRKGDMLLEYASNLRLEDGLKKRKTLRTASNTALEEAVYSWFVERREAGNPVSGPLICEKALEMNLQLGGPPEFKASSGWLKNFKTRHNIKMQDLIVGDLTAREARNKIKELYGDKSKSEIQCSDSQRLNSDSEMDSQLSSDKTNSFPIITKTPEQEITDAVSSILQSPEEQTCDIDDHEYTVSFPTVTTELSPSDQENSDMVEDEYTNSSPTVLLHSPNQENSVADEDSEMEVLHPPDQENSVADEDSEVEVLHPPDQEHSDAEKDTYSESPKLPEHKYSDAVAEAPLVSYPSIEAVLPLPDQRNSSAVEVMSTDLYPVTSILPDQDNSGAVAESPLVLYPSIETVVYSPDQRKTSAVEGMCTDSYPVTSILPDQENSGAAEEAPIVSYPSIETVVYSPDQRNSSGVDGLCPDSYPVTSILPDQENLDAVEEAPLVSYPSIETVVHSPDQRHSSAVDNLCPDSYPGTSILPDQENLDAVEDVYMAPYPMIKTDLHSPDQKNFHAAEGESTDSYPVTSILPDLDNSDATDGNNMVPIKIEIKQEPPDEIDDEPVMTEDDPGPSDKEAVIALETVVEWLERQPDRTASQLSTLRSIRDFAIYKASLGGLPRGANAVIP